MKKDSQSSFYLWFCGRSYRVNMWNRIYFGSCRCMVEKGQGDQEIMAIYLPLGQCCSSQPQAQQRAISSGPDAPRDSPHVDDDIIETGMCRLRREDRGCPRSEEFDHVP